MGASESRSGRSHHPCGDGGDRTNHCREPQTRKDGGSSRQRTFAAERDWLVWPYSTARKGADGGRPQPEPAEDAAVDNAFVIGVFDSPTPDATRVGELYKGQVVVGVAEWHTRVGRGPLGLGLACSEEDTWLRLAAQSLPWAEGTPSELWVHMEHRRASCCEGVQLQVYLVEAPGKKLPPPLPEPEPEAEPQPQPEPQLVHQRSPRRFAVDTHAEVDEAEPLAGALDRSSLDVLRVSASSLEAMDPLASEIDRSSLDALRVSASSMEAMRLSNSSSRCSTEEDVTQAHEQPEMDRPAVACDLPRRAHATAAEHALQKQAVRSCEGEDSADDLRAMRKQLKTAKAAESDARP